MMGRALFDQTITPELLSGLRKMIGYLARSPEDVEDILQQVLLKIHKSGDSVEPAKFFAWMKTVCRTTAIDFYRKQKKTSQLTETQIRNLNVDSEAESNDTPERLAKCMRPLIKKLKTEDAKILTMIELEEVSQIQAAEQLAIPYSSFKSKVQRARGKLKEAVLDCCEIHVDRNNRPIHMKQKSRNC